jgi:hypothetical protein
VTPENRSDAYKSSEEEDFAEIFRRLPGFRAYYDEFVAPLLMRRSADEQLRAEQDARRQLAGQLVAHLTQFSGYYTQGFLHWSARTLGPSLFAAEVQSWLGWAFWGAGVSVPSSLLKALVPPESIALRDNAVIVSGWYDIEVIAELHAALAAANNAAAAELVALIDTIYGPAGTTPPEPTCVDVDLPIDGAYVEPVAGTCVLEDVPPPPPPAPVPPIP